MCARMPHPCGIRFQTLATAIIFLKYKIVVNKTLRNYKTADNCYMKSSFFILIMALSLFLPRTYAAKLFGVDLLTETKTTLRQAAKQGGARLKKEAGELEFYDEYFSADILKGSNKLFLGFSKKTEKFAFAEYEFKGLNNDKMLQKLISKYGQPVKIKKIYISDVVYRWNVGGVEISFYQDWHNYKTRVTYIVPKLLAELKVAKNKVDEAIVRGELNKQINVY